jgi:hypothetical protein
VGVAPGLCDTQMEVTAIAHQSPFCRSFSTVGFRPSGGQRVGAG